MRSSAGTTAFAAGASTAFSVLHVAPSVREVGGQDMIVSSLCEALARSGIRTALIAPGDSPRDAAAVLPEKQLVPTTLLRSREIPLTRQRVCRELTSVLDRACCQGRKVVLHTHGCWTPTNHAVAGVARRRGVPLVTSPRGTLLPWALRQSRLKKQAALWLYQRRDLATAALLHATCEDEAEALRLLGLSNPIVIAPNGVNMEKIPDSTVSAQNPDRRRTLLFLSRVHPKKGLLRLVKAWSVVRPIGWRVVIAGPDEAAHQSAVAAAIRNLRVDSDFEFIGPVNGAEKWACLQRADIFILPTHSENFGTVVAEALACGVPVITTKGAPWSDLAESRCGWWVDNNVTGLIGAFRQALSVPSEELREMGSRGRQLVVNRYSWPVVVSRLTSAYEWLAGVGPKPAFIV